MVATEATTDTKPAAIVLEMLERMEALAANGEWDRTERLAVRIKSAVLDVPEDERQSVVVAVSQTLERVQTRALSSRSEVTDKLSGIRRGRAATRAYGQPPAGSPSAALR
jgi:hypothetical protein